MKTRTRDGYFDRLMRAEPPTRTNLSPQPVATLLSDGTVLLSARTAEADLGGIKAQVYAPWLQSFLPSYAAPRNPQVSALEGSVPENRAADVPVDAVIGIRFSKRLRAESLSSATIVLSDGVRHVDARIVPAEGILVFITPTEPLARATPYMVAIDGAKDEEGSPVPYSILTFTTANGPGLSGQNTTITDNQAGAQRVKIPLRYLLQSNARSRIE